MGFCRFHYFMQPDERLQHAFSLLAHAPERTVALAEAALLQTPAHSAWLTAKALALSALRKPEAAASIYRQLQDLEPEIPEHHANFGNALLELGQPHQARGALLRALELGADDGNTFFALARAALECGDPLLAHQEVLKALKSGLDQDLEVALLYLKVLISVDEIELARDNARRLLPAAMPPELACEFALLVLQLSDYEGAEEAALKVPKHAPEFPMALISLALSYERSNKMDKVQASRQQIANCHVDYAMDSPVERLLSSSTGRTLMQLDARLCMRARNFARAITLLEALLESGHPLDSSIYVALQFELAKALDAAKMPERSFALLETAHERRFQQVALAHPKMAAEDDPLYLLDVVPEVFSQVKVEDDGDLDPVFVVGFPRSGTTLLEQLLDAHDGLQSFDEQPFLQRCILKIQALGLQYPEELARLDAEQIRALRIFYFSECQRVSPKANPSVRYVDKNPLNLSRLPIIQMLFPKASIIVVLRHPADCVLSCFQQHFRAPAFAVAMRTLASTAVMYHRVFSFYHALQPKLRLANLELKYEDLVADTEAQAKRLIVFLGLPWDARLMRFTERARSRSISTPSYAAVTEAVNSAAVFKFKRYQSYFDDSGAAKTLVPWVNCFGYDA